jgi:protein-disulfide isomerase
MPTAPPTVSLKPPLTERDHVQGSPNAPIELVEYGDYECPHCGNAAAIVTQLQAEFGERLRFAFRHFPLAKMHPHARKAAMAAEAAGAQGQFWEMHESLFRGAPALDYASLLGYAKQLGLDTARFEKEIADDTYAQRIQEDVASGVRSGVNGTPTFFINGSRLNGGYAIEALRAAIAEAS